MARITSIVITLSDEDLATKGGLHILAQMVSGYLGDQFDLSVAIRVEDERGKMMNEWVPASAYVPDGMRGAANETRLRKMIDIPQTYLPDGMRDDFAGLIGN